MKINLFISTFNREVTWKNCIPVEVGANIRDNFIYPIKDNEGDNISELNPWFGELTGIYWIWKNYSFNEDDIVGFGHWNKILDISEKKIYEFFEDAKNNKEKCIITADRGCIVPHDFPDDVAVLENVLSEKYPEYYDTFQKLFNSDGSSKDGMNTYVPQLFYMNVEEFNKYCSFIFGTLLEVFNRIGKVEREKYHRRYLAFLAERIITVYLDTNNIIPKCSVEVKYKNNGKILRRIKMIVIPILKKTPFYETLKVKFGTGSSYK